METPNGSLASSFGVISEEEHVIAVGEALSAVPELAGIVAVSPSLDDRRRALLSADVHALSIEIAAVAMDPTGRLPTGGPTSRISALAAQPFASQLAVEFTEIMLTECGIDEAGFADEAGLPCSAWGGYECDEALGASLGYSSAGMSHVVAACRESCGLCEVLPLGGSGSWQPAGAWQDLFAASAGMTLAYRTAMNLTVSFAMAASVVPPPGAHAR